MKNNNEDIGLVVDSTCGFSEEEAKKMGLFYVPITIQIDGKDYKDGVDLLEEDLVNMMTPKNKILTASPSIGEYIKIFDEGLKKHKKLFYLSYSHKMSNIHNSSLQAIKESRFKGKVFAPKTVYMSAWLHVEVKKMINMIKKGTTITSLEKVVDEQNKNLIGVLSMKTLTYLKNGGRVRGAKAYIGSALRIAPVAVYRDGLIDPKDASKARTFEKASDKTIHMFSEYWKKITNKDDFAIITLISPKISDHDINAYFDKIRNILSLPNTYKFIQTKAGSSVVSHIGPDYIGLGLYKK